MFRSFHYIIVCALLLFSCSSEKQAETQATVPPDEKRVVSESEKPGVSGEETSYSLGLIPKNSPPELSKVKILPEVFKPGDVLNVEVTGSDPDGDEVTFLYEWTKNGEPAGNGKQIEGTLKRGDTVSIRVTPFDGEDYGNPVFLQREIQNMPPMIAEDTAFNFDGMIYTHQVKATDPDGDPLSYSLKSSTEGVSIDSQTGLVTWNVPPDFTGKIQITVSVSDGNGGEMTRDLTMTVALPKPR